MKIETVQNDSKHDFTCLSRDGGKCDWGSGSLREPLVAEAKMEEWSHVAQCAHGLSFFDSLDLPKICSCIYRVDFMYQNSH